MLEENKGLPELTNANSLNSEIISRTNNLDTYIEENSSQNLKYMEFETTERLNHFLNEYQEMLLLAQNLEEDYNTDATIKKIEKEVIWYQDRVQTFSQIKENDEKCINHYKTLIDECKKSKPVLEYQLKSLKGDVLKLRQLIRKPFSISPTKLSSFTEYPKANSMRFSLTSSEKEQYDYLKSASTRLKNTLEEVRNEISKYRSEEFQNRQKVLPIEEFFNDCYKSVYHLIFQRQSQLDDYQLSLAYKLFREKKMEYSGIKHRSHANSARYENYVVRDALESKARTDLKKKNVWDM